MYRKMAYLGHFLVILPQPLVYLRQSPILLFSCAETSLSSPLNAKRGGDKPTFSVLKRMIDMKNIIVMSSLLMLALGNVAYAGEAQPDTSRLVKVSKGAFKDTWVNPDVELGKFHKVMIVGSDFEFREVKKTPRMSGSYKNNQSDFWVDEKDRLRAQEIIASGFGERMSKSFEIVDEAGPGVLVVYGRLSDIVSNVPPNMVGSGRNYISKIGAATIELEARDSLTGEIVFQASERSEIEPRGRRMMESNSVLVNAELRRWSQRVAAKLVKGLEAQNS
jgi:hypothetical protein